MHRYILAILLLIAVGGTAHGILFRGGGATPLPSTCPRTTTFSDGCAGAQANGTIVDAHLADFKSVIDLNINGGSGYTSGTYTWTSSGGGCSVAATGTVTVVGGIVGGQNVTNGRGIPANYSITNGGTGCTSRPTIAIPAGAAGGSGASITPTVYQLTPHNASGTAIGSNWNVAGVDYPVGYDTTLSLKDPTVTANLPSCASISGKTVTIHSAPCTVNGFDFTLHDTHLVVGSSLGSSSLVTISNNNFNCTVSTTTTLDNIHINGGGQDVKIYYNTFNGGSSTRGTLCGPSGGMNAAIGVDATGGTVDIEYNYCYYQDSKCVETNSGGSSGSPLVLIEKYNYWVDYGMCGGGCSHGEAEYTFAGSSTATVSYTMAFNVMLQHYWTGTTNVTAAAALEADGIVLNNPTTLNNYAMARGNQSYTGNSNSSGQVSSGAFYCGHQESGSYTGTPTWDLNISDYSGGFFAVNDTSGTCGSDFPSWKTYNAGSGNSCTISTCN